MNTPTISRRRLKREDDILTLFEHLFEQVQEPISAAYFKQVAEKEYQSIYSKNMIHEIFRSLRKQKKIQIALSPTPHSAKFLYVPLTVNVPKKKRLWRTVAEQEAEAKEHVHLLPSLSEEDFFFFVESAQFGHIHFKGMIKLKKRERMPLYEYLKTKGEVYTRFLTLVRPYVPLLEKREQIVLSERIGLDTGVPRSFKEIGKELDIAYSQTSAVFGDSLFSILKWMEKKRKETK